MAISDDLNSIRTHLEDDYKTLEQLGVSVEDKNIENIKDMANQIYAKFPKTDYAEGSNITLSNTLKGKLDFEDGIVGYGDTKQDSTNGYQLLNLANSSNTSNGITSGITDGSILKISGKATQTWANIVVSVPFTLASGSYTFSINSSINANLAITTNNSESINILKNTTSRNATLSSATTSITISLSGMTVDDTFNATLKMQLESGSTAHTWEEYSGGYSSPSPNWEQDIEVVRGKNLFSSEIELGSLASGNKIASTTIYRTKNYIEVQPNKEYIFSINSTANRVAIMFYDSTKTWIDRDSSAQGTLSVTGKFTTPSNCKYVMFRSYTDDFNLWGNGNIQLEQGSQATSYLPYNTIEVVERGKNLVEFQDTTITLGGGNTLLTSQPSMKFNKSFMYSGNQTSNLFTTKLKAGTYSFSGFRVLNTNVSLRIYNLDNENFLWTTPINTGNFTLDVDTNIAIRIFTYSDESIVGETIYPQLEEGSTATTYEPYQTPQTYQLSLGEYEFAKIGNYVDTIEYDVDEDKVYKNKAVGKSIINGNSGTISRTATNRFNIDDFPNDYKKQANEILCLSNLYIAYAQKGTNGEFDNLVANVNYAIELSSNTSAVIHTIRIKDIRFDSIDDFKTSLNNNNLILYYALVTATREEITGTLKDQIKALYYSHSFTGTTIIEIDGQLPLILKVRGLKAD